MLICFHSVKEDVIKFLLIFFKRSDYLFLTATFENSYYPISFLMLLITITIKIVLKYSDSYFTNTNQWSYRAIFKFLEIHINCCLSDIFIELPFIL